jgi:HD-GYP domain-containing protein (c-di-GMP phosphodiesterase class II)
LRAAAADAATRLGFADGAILTLRRAALVHEFGTTAVPNSIWDKAGPLTRAEFDRWSFTRCSPSRCSAAHQPSPC